LRDGHVHYSWLVLAIRFGSRRNPDERNPILGAFLRSYHALFTSALFFNTKRVTNQSFALRTITIYLQAMKQHCESQQNPLTPLPPGQPRPKTLHFDDFHSNSTKLEAAKTIMTLFLDEPHLLTENQLLPFLEATFRSNDPTSIASAARICFTRLTPEKVQKLAADNDAVGDVLCSLFTAMMEVPLDTAIDILKLVPSFSSVFLSVEPPNLFVHKEIHLPNYSCDLSKY
jgi:hypothetical protein